MPSSSSRSFDTVSSAHKESSGYNTFSTSDIEKYASYSGLSLKVEDKGLFLKIEAYPYGENDEPIGYLTAFIRPINLLHLDTIQVKNRRQTLGFKRRNWTIDGPGISFIMGSFAIKWAYDKGCRRSELLAVKDTPTMHMILVRLYESFGFKAVREVGDDGGSIGDRLVWGAVGTLMEMNLDSFFTEWKPKFQVLLSDAMKKSTDTLSDGDEGEETMQQLSKTPE